MVTVISRFRVRNGLEGEVRRAFLERPRRVEGERGFCGLEVLTDASDPSVFVLLTRWTSEPAFRAWHHSDAHHRSHEMIPQGLKLDASFTQLVVGERIEDAGGARNLDEALEGRSVAVSRWLTESDTVFALVMGSDGVIRFRNRAAARLFLADPGGTIWNLCSDAEYLRDKLSGSRAAPSNFLLNMAGRENVTVSAEATVIQCGGGFLVLGSIDQTKSLELRDELLSLTNQLSVMSRDASRRSKELEEANRTIERLARTDALTGLWNRRMFDESLQREMARADRQSQPLTMILFDLDHFKSVNDTYGHVAGDQVLARAGEVLKGQVRQYDIPARYGGEEFAVLLPGTAKEVGAAIAERLRETIAAVRFSEGPERITISLGVAAWAKGEVANVFLERVDSALYKAKKLGRNRVETDVSFG